VAFDLRFPSGGLLLAGHVALPASRPKGSRPPGLVLTHGLPGGVRGARTTASSFPELADRIARELGWVVLAFTSRGAGQSEGDFSLGGWRDDLKAAIDHLTRTEPLLGVWTVGFGAGGSLAICVAADDRRVRGVATLGAPADFTDWADQPRRLLEHSRDIGLIRDAAFPQSFELWARPLRELRASTSAARLGRRSLLVMHGSEDVAVPEFDARVLADAHGHAELSLLPSAGHRIRHDPRAVAILLGWLDRQYHDIVAGTRAVAGRP
jgi:putative redox protein